MCLQERIFQKSPAVVQLFPNPFSLLGFLTKLCKKILCIERYPNGKTELVWGPGLLLPHSCLASPSTKILLYVGPGGSVALNPQFRCALVSGPHLGDISSCRLCSCLFMCQRSQGFPGTLSGPHSLHTACGLQTAACLPVHWTGPEP